MSERQDVFKRLDGHPRAYEFLETLLKTDKSLTWSNLAQQIGKVEAKIWEDLLLEKLYQCLSPSEQQLLQVCAVFISRTPIALLTPDVGVEAFSFVWDNSSLIETGGLLGLCLYDAENQTFEVHRLTREWIVRNVIDIKDLKMWAFWTGEYFEKNTSLKNHELAREYYEIAEAWKEFVRISFKLQNYYQLVSFYQRAFELNQVILDKRFNEISYAEALLNNGLILKFYGKLEEALKNYLISLEIVRKESHLQGEGAVLNNISQIYYVKGDLETSINYLEMSLVIRKKVGDIQGIGITLNNLATSYQDNGEEDKALNYLNEALSIMEQIGDIQGQGAILNNLATNYLKNDDTDLTLEYLEKAKYVQQIIGDRKGLGNTLNNISQIYYLRTEYDKSIKILKECISIQREIRDIQGLSTSLSNIGAIYFTHKNDIENAVSAMAESYMILSKIDSPDFLKSEENLIRLIGHIGEKKFQEIISKLNQ